MTQGMTKQEEEDPRAAGAGPRPAKRRKIKRKAARPKAGPIHLATPAPVPAPVPPPQDVQSLLRALGDLQEHQPPLSERPVHEQRENLESGARGGPAAPKPSLPSSRALPRPS